MSSISQIDALPSASVISASTSPYQASSTRHPRVPSCLLCQNRKVKCDRKEPCSGCVRAGVECVPSLPASVRRRRKNIDEGQLAARLRRCEELLRGYDANALQNTNSQAVTQGRGAETHIVQEPITAETRSFVEPGKIIFEHGMPRFVDNNLWTSLYDEFRDLKEMLQSPPQSSDDSSIQSSESSFVYGGALILGASPTNQSLSSIHPGPVQIFRLWQTFLDNVNPLSKILHTSSTQTRVLEASENLEATPKNIEVLLFAIYTSAVASLSNEECSNLMGDSKSVLLRRYSAATQQALVDIGFMKTSDIVVLQAFVLFLLARRQHHDPNELWVLSGVAIRIGQRLGLHRDGTTLGMNGFEIEFRRRLWWQIMLLDNRSAQLSGASTSSMATDWDTKMPSNLNDGDLIPGMLELPLAHSGQTEMIFCLVICEIAKFFRDLSAKSADGSWQSGAAGNWQNSGSRTWVDLGKPMAGASSATSGQSTLDFASAWQTSDHSNPTASEQAAANKHWKSSDSRDQAGSFSFHNKLMKDLEDHIETKFLRYCDSSIPLHQLTIIVARSIMATVKLMSHHPRHRPDKGAGMLPEEKDYLFGLSMKIIEYDIQGHTLPNLKRFVWHINIYFQQDVFVFLLSELRHRPVGPSSDKAWEYVEDLYRFHPELLADDTNALYLAIGNLTLRVWGAHEAEFIRQYHKPPRTPDFVSSLRSQRLLPQTSDSSASFSQQHEQEQGQGISSQFVISHDKMNPQVGAIGYGDTMPQYHAMNYNESAVEMEFMDWDYWNQLLAPEHQSGNGQSTFS